MKAEIVQSDYMKIVELLGESTRYFHDAHSALDWLEPLGVEISGDLDVEGQIDKLYSDLEKLKESIRYTLAAQNKLILAVTAVL